MALSMSVSRKVWLPILIAAAGFAAVVGLAHLMIADQMLADRTAKLRGISESAVSVVSHFEKESAAGRMSADAAKGAAIAALRELRYDGGSGYVYIYTIGGEGVMIPPKPALEGKSQLEMKDAAGVPIVRDFIAQVGAKGHAETRYLWEKPGSKKPEPKLSYTIGFAPWGWMVGTGVYVDDVDAETWAVTARLLGVSAVFLLLVVGPSAWIGRSIARPITAMTRSMERLSQGADDVEIEGLARSDEIGAMAKAMQVFKETLAERLRLETEAEAKEEHAAEERREAMRKVADDFETAIGDVLRQTSTTARNLTELARVMAENAARTAQEAQVVREASDVASRNVETVASASEELTASIGEIANQVQEASTSARDTAAEAETANTRVQELSNAATRIGEIIKLINDIAEQTNLLALNATIEAARAGDAGKGFAVVAGEVKALATQTARATQDITQQINDIQTETRTVATAIGKVAQRIGGIDDVTASIAAAIEEQTAATSEISRSVQEAAQGTMTVSQSVGSVVAAAEQAHTASDKLSTECKNLLRQTTDLKVAVDDVLGAIREE